MLRMAPPLFFVCVAIAFAIATVGGRWLRHGRSVEMSREQGSVKTLESAILALLGLLLGFTFSMAVSRFDARKALEIDEANDIGTLWLRTSLLRDSSRDAERLLITHYADARLNFLAAGLSQQRLDESARETGALQAQMWRVAVDEENVRRDSVTGLFIASLNDTIDVTEKRTAALENTIPVAAWGMLIFIGFIGCALVAAGFEGNAMTLRLLLPLVLACTMTMIYDIDSPRSGLIRVQQQSMERLERSLQPHR